MDPTALIRTHEDTAPPGLAWPLLLTTLSALLLELSLTRLFSVVLYYHYAFLVISFALLGLASGGILARLLPVLPNPARHRKRMAIFCLGASASLLPCLYFALGTNISMVVSFDHLTRLSLLYLVCMLPFVASGVVVASVMAVGSGRIARLYFFDLIGAALGCLLFVPLIETIGGAGAILSVGVLFACAAFLWACGSGAPWLRRASLASAAIFVALVALSTSSGWIDVQYTRGMPRKNELFSKWNSFSRVSVHEDDRGERWIELDGGAGTWLSHTDLEGDEGRLLREQLGQTGPELAFWMSRGKRPRTLVVGPGGGYDLVRALAAGSTSVTAVEINPIITDDIMRGAFAGYSRGIYTRPEVTVFNEDGRTFLKRTGDKYDVIQLSQVDTWASSASGAYALTENYLYTVEALEAYLDRLGPGGLVSIGRWEFPEPRETLRLTSVALEALTRQHVEHPARHVVVVLETIGSIAAEWPKMGTVIVAKDPFSDVQVAGLRKQISAHPHMSLVYAPGVSMTESTGYAEPFSQLILARDRAAFARSYPFDIAPVYDDRPFFFFFYRWTHFVRSLVTVDPTGDALNASAQMLLFVILALSLVGVALFLFGPLFAFKRRFPSRRDSFPSLLYCVFVGLAFILVEIALIQRFVIYLGDPALSLTVVIFALLLSSSLGSRLSGLLETERLPAQRFWVIPAIALMTLVHLLAVPRILDLTQGASHAVKVALSVASIFPLGLCMGLPFPSGLRLISKHRKDMLEWAWAVNAAATVLGSVVAIVWSMQFGISATMLMGVAFYAGAGLLMAWIPRRGPFGEQALAPLQAMGSGDTVHSAGTRATC